MSTGNGYADLLNSFLKKMEAKEIRFNVLNDILDMMEVKQIVFSMTSLGNESMITLEFVGNIFGMGYEYMRKFYWKNIDSMFNDKLLNIANVVNYIKENSSIYGMLDCNTMKFLEIISGCHSLKEFLLKIQLMGY
jgi:3'-phosphoadenosine 5'-phosphosulfate sulfotransferase (PAPS reductase)/FAD synthetase